MLSAGLRNVGHDPPGNLHGDQGIAVDVGFRCYGQRLCRLQSADVSGDHRATHPITQSVDVAICALLPHRVVIRIFRARCKILPRELCNYCVPTRNWAPTTSSYYNLIHPRDLPNGTWQVRVQVVMLFPKSK